MQMSLNEDQRLLEASALDLLSAEYGFHQRAASLTHPEACLPQRWRQFAELGWLALPIAEEQGGLGGGPLETGLLMRALGRHLVVEPYHASVVLAGSLLSRLGDERHMALLAQALAGEQRLALAHEEVGVDSFAPRITRARRTAQGWLLQGQKPLVAGAPGAGWLLVSAMDEAGETCVFLVPADAPGLQLLPCHTTDDGRAADVRLHQVALDEAARLPGAAGVADTLQRVLAKGLLALCWEATGTLQAALEQTVNYTHQRMQFGQPLARFQVVQHRLAEMAVCCDEARAACELAALRIAATPGDAGTALAMAALARSKTGRAARLVAQEAVQLHGGMGVCEELPVAAMFRRLTAFGQRFGPTALHSRRYGRHALSSNGWRLSATLSTTEGVPA